MTDIAPTAAARAALPLLLPSALAPAQPRRRRARAAHRRLHRRRGQPGAGHRRRGRAAHGARARRSATRSGARLPPDAELRQQVLDALIDERVHHHLCARQRHAGRRGRARPRGGQRRGAEPDHAAAAARAPAPPKASTTRAFAPTCATRCWSSGCASARCSARIRITDAEIDALLDQQRGRGRRDAELQHRADPRHGARRRRARPRSPSGARAPMRALARVRGGEDFDDGGARGLRRRQPRAAAARSACARPTGCPTCSSRPCSTLKPGEVAPTPLRTGAGFHVLKVVERARRPALSRHADARAPHPAAHRRAQLTAAGRVAPAGRVQAPDRGRQRRASRTLARENSEDGSAAQGGDLGWAVAGQFRARVRGGDERAADRRHVGAGGVALRRAPDPGAWSGARSRSTPSSCASRRATCCASRSSTQAYADWAQRAARARLRRDARAAASLMARRAVKHIARKRFGQHFLADAASSTRSCARSIRGRARRWSRSARAWAR